MRLEHLFDMEMLYDGDPPFHVWKPWGTEGFGYGRGGGTVSNGAITGRLAWYNFPRWRGDGSFLPDGRGMIDADDGARILFTLHGLSVEAKVPEASGGASGGAEGFAWMNQSGGSRRSVTLSMMFQTADERHLWLNTTLAVAEATIDLRSLGMRVRVYMCVNEIVNEPG